MLSRLHLTASDDQQLFLLRLLHYTNPIMASKDNPPESPWDADLKAKFDRYLIMFPFFFSNLENLTSTSIPS